MIGTKNNIGIRIAHRFFVEGVIVLTLGNLFINALAANLGFSVQLFVYILFVQSLCFYGEAIILFDQKKSCVQ